MNFVFDRDENIVRKGENSGYQYFLFVFHNVFESVLLQDRLNLGLCGEELKLKSFYI